MPLQSDHGKPHRGSQPETESSPLGPLADLSSKPVWAARGCPEDHADDRGKPVRGDKGEPYSKRGPINPKTGRKALTNNPATFAPRAAAEKRAASWGDKAREPGVGLLLGRAHAQKGLIRAALDVDGMRDPETGELELVADQIATVIDSYCEQSPSGTGLRVLFNVAEETIEALRGEGLIVSDEGGRTFSGPNGSHREIALKASGFVTITDRPVAGAWWGRPGGAAIRTVGVDDLRTLLGEIGPQWKAEETARVGGPGGDASGSGVAFRAAMDLFKHFDLDRERVEAVLTGEIEPGPGATSEDLETAREWWSRAPERERGRTLTNARKQAEEKKTAEEKRQAKITAEFTDEAGDEAGDEEAPSGERLIDALNRRFAVVSLGATAAVADLRERPVIFRKVADFRNLIANLESPSPKTTLASWWLKHPERRTYWRVDFRPGEATPRGTFNLWRGWAVPAGDLGAEGCPLILRHIREVICDDDPAVFDYVIGWLAHLVQKPWEKPDVALVLRGDKGVGKDTLAGVEQRIVGGDHTDEIRGEGDLTNRFNESTARALLVHIEEAMWSGSRLATQHVQRLITSPSISMEPKGFGRTTVRSFCRVLMTTNARWAAPASGADERRYAILDVSDRYRGDRAYFDSLYAEIKGEGTHHFRGYLESVDLNRFEPRDFPRTAALDDVRAAGLAGFEAWWHEVLSDGDLGGAWPETWPSDEGIEVEARELRDLYDAWCKGNRKRGREMSSVEFGKALGRACPSAKRWQKRVEGGRTNTYRLPDRACARGQFEAAAGVKFPPEVDPLS